MLFFSGGLKRSLGVDIGTTSVKVVELSKNKEGKIKLETYGSLESIAYSKSLEETLQSSTVKISDQQAAEMIKKLIKEAKVKTRKAVMSAPVFSTFTSIIELPEMSQQEIESAIRFEAKQYVPVPLSEVVLGWNVIGKKNYELIGSGSHSNKVLVLIVAIPKELSNEFAKIADLANLDLVALETESFALIRSLLGNDKSTVAIVDIGSRATNISIVSEGFIRVSRGLDTSGVEITKILAKGMGIDIKRANELKRKIGLDMSGSNKQVANVILPIVDVITGETKRIIDIFSRKEGAILKVERIILAGGSAGIPKIADRFTEVTGIKTIIGNPWSRTEYPLRLQKTLEAIGPSFSVAAGLAMRNI